MSHGTGFDPIDEAKRRILSRVPLDGLIGETVKLQTRSGKPIGLCPFHEEKSPSFYIYGDHFYCFGCQANGDAIDFVRKTQGLGYIETLRFLAGKYSIDAPELEESAHRVRQRNDDAALAKIMVAAQDIFVAGLASPRGDAARTYLLERGFTTESIQAFGFGLTPQEPWGLVKALRLSGFSEEDMRSCSLAAISEKTGRAYDFFRDRIMIPIRDPHGRVIAFGGRTLVQDPAKYKNSSATRLFDKSATLYGFDRARLAVRDKHRAIIVEGYMDCLQLWQQGFTETVACLGTALTVKHLQLIRTTTNDVILLFDGDNAGRKASLTAVEVAMELPQLRVRVAVLPANEDPDTFVRRSGPEGLEKLLTAATDLFDFAITSRLKSCTGLQVPEVMNRELIPWLATVPDRVQRVFLVGRLAQLSGVPAATIESELRSLTASPPPTAMRAAPARLVPPAEAPRGPVKPLEHLEFDLIGHLYYAEPGELDLTHLTPLVKDELSLDPVWAQLASELLSVLGGSHSPSSPEGEKQLTSASYPEVQTLLARYKASKAAFHCTDRRQRAARLILLAKQKNLKKTISSLKSQVSILARTPDGSESLRNLLGAISGLSQQLSALDTSLRSI